MIVCPLYHGRGQKKSAPPERGAEKHSDLTAFLEQPFESFPEGNDPGPGQKVIDQHGTDGGLDGALAHMEPEIFARELWHRAVSSSGLLAVSLLALSA
jgi:hypothetical protein